MGKKIENHATCEGGLRYDITQVQKQWDTIIKFRDSMLFKSSTEGRSTLSGGNPSII